MIKQLVHICAAGMLLQLILLSVSAQKYRIRLDQPEKVGDKYHLLAMSSTNVKTNVTVEGQFAKSSEDGFTLQLSADVTILAANPSNWATRKSFVILSSKLARGATSGPLLPDGTVVLALIENGKTTYQVDGRPLSDEITHALRSVISLHLAVVADDEMFGTTDMKKVGESWPVSIDATAQLLKEIGVQSGSPKIRGTTTLEKVEENHIFVRSSIDVQNALLPIAPGITPEIGEIGLEFSGRFPLLESDFSRDVNQRTTMATVGTTEPGKDDKRTKVNVIFDQKSSFEIRPINNSLTPNNPPQKQSQAAKAAEEEVGPDDVIRIKTTLVNSPVLVIGRDGKYIPTLRREDFQVFEDGVKQDIAYFAPVESPFIVALLIDTSRSTLFDLQDIQDAAIAFVDKMRPNDQALIVSFAHEIKVLAEPTSDRDVLRRAIRSSRPGGSSRVYDAIDFAITERLNRIAGRKALIVFTDGVDNNSNSATYESSLRKLARSETLVYPVQFSTLEDIKEKSARNTPKRRIPPEGTGFSKVDYLRADAYLHQAAEATGTALHPASDINDLERAVASIVEELHNEYSLGYYPRIPAQPGEVRRMEVKVHQPQLVVRARTGYLVDQSGAVLQAPKGERQTMPSIRSELGLLSVPRISDEARPAAGARWMCKGPDVPGDFAVVKEGFDAHCPKSARRNDRTNAWFIRKPGPIEILCKGFLIWNGRELAGAPIPTGYVVIGELEAPVCAKSNDPRRPANAWAVRLPGRGRICKGFVIPRGFVVVGERMSRACPTSMSGKNAWVIRKRS